MCNKVLDFLFFSAYVIEAGSVNSTVWIGANDMTRDQCWMWSDQSFFVYSNWATGQCMLQIIQII